MQVLTGCYSLASVLMSRFLLNLREVRLPKARELPTYSARFTSAGPNVHLGSAFLGNLAAPMSVAASDSSYGTAEVWDDPLMAGLEVETEAGASEFELNIVT